MRKLSMIFAGILALVLAALPISGFAASDMTPGQVIKIDEAAAKITLKHGPMKKLNMDGGMTMVYHVQDPALLKPLKVGDEVEFDAEQLNGVYTVTKIQKLK